MREWLSWWSTTLPRLGSRVRVPSRALIIRKKDIQKRISFFLIMSPAGRKESIDRKSSWFGLTYGIGMCYAERNICKNGNRRVICLFLLLKCVIKPIAENMGNVKRISWRKEGERRDGGEKGREN